MSQVVADRVQVYFAASAMRPADHRNSQTFMDFRDRDRRFGARIVFILYVAAAGSMSTNPRPTDHSPRSGYVIRLNQARTPPDMRCRPAPVIWPLGRLGGILSRLHSRSASPMTQRAIVSDPAISEGRWHFETTHIFIEDLRRDFANNGDLIRAPYQMLSLTDEEIDAALDFIFPELATPQAEILSIDIMVRCVCGIHRHVRMDWTTMNTDPCPCGRTWHITTGIELVPVAHPSPQVRSL